MSRSSTLSVEGEKSEAIAFTDGAIGLFIYTTESKTRRHAKNTIHTSLPRMLAWNRIMHRTAGGKHCVLGFPSLCFLLVSG